MPIVLKANGKYLNIILYLKHSVSYEIYIYIVGGQRKKRFIAPGFDEVTLERALNGRERFGRDVTQRKRTSNKRNSVSRIGKHWFLSEKSPG